MNEERLKEKRKEMKDKKKNKRKGQKGNEWLSLEEDKIERKKEIMKEWVTIYIYAYRLI